MLCLYNPACAGFNTDGWLKAATNDTRPNAPCDLYVKTAGAPARTHYLKIEKWDADYEDLPGGKLPKDIAVLEAACSKNTACAGFNSNGILKQTMNTTGRSSCDLYVKLGGESHPLPPGPPPGPSPPHTGPLVPPPAGPWAPYIWPLPKTYTNGSTTLTVSKPAPGGAGFFKFPAGNPPKTLTAAFERYTHLTLPHNVEPNDDPSVAADDTKVTGVTVTVDNLSEEHPQLETDESYSLNITAAGKVSLHAATVYGVLRGLETFSQLVRFDFDVNQHILPLAPWTIVDEPRFPHRGLVGHTSAGIIMWQGWFLL